MKITMLFGSPHLDGTTNVLAEQFAAGARQAGHEVTRFNLAKMKIAPCMACNYCRRTGNGCIQKDEMQQLAPALQEAELVVFVTPLYYFAMSAQIKTTIDRFYGINEALRQTAKKAVLLAACADTDDDAMDGLAENYRLMCRYLHWEDAGRVLAFGCGDKNAVEATQYPQQAFALGTQIR